MEDLIQKIWNSGSFNIPNSEKNRVLFLDETVKLSNLWYILLRRLLLKYDGNLTGISDISLFDKSHVVLGSNHKNATSIVHSTHSEIAFSPDPYWWKHFGMWYNSNEKLKNTRFSDNYSKFRSIFSLSTVYMDSAAASFDDNLAELIPTENLPKTVPRFNPNGEIDENYPFSETVLYAKNMLKTQENSSKFIYFQFLNSFYLKMTRNWICKVKHIQNILAKTLFVVTDADTYFSLKNDGIPNVMFFNTGFQNPTNLKYGSAAYYKYMKYRSDLILKLLTAEVSLFVVEADATWYGDPGESLAKFENMDFVAGQDGGLKDEKIECGFLFMNATENAKTTWTDLTVLLDKYTLLRINTRSEN
jgi:hypothetical protein